MSGHSTNTNQHLIRSNLWTNQLKEVFEDELGGLQYVNMLSDFPDGDTWNIPSLGQMETYDYEEGQAVRYSALDTGNFTFTVTKYKSTATYITNKMKQDSFYMSQLVSSFVPKMQRALAVAMETDLLAVGPIGQTASDPNAINGANHRFVASGTNETITIDDFAKARYALRKASVPMTNLVAIVDPSVTHHLGTLTNISNLAWNPRWEGIVSSGATTGMKFVMNVHGFDVYESNFLKVNAASETINPGSGNVTAAAGVNNLFFSADSTALPFIGAIRQSPTVESDYNKDLQREEYVMTARYDFKLFRPENLVVVLTDTDQVYA